MPIQLPDRMFAPEIVDAPPPPVDPMVAREEKIANDTRVEQALNRFLAAKQDTLFDAPDAFYRTQGEDAIHAAPVATKNLQQLRNTLLDGLANDYQRQRLGDALDAQMQVTRDGMARHVAEQSLAWQRQVAQDRIALLTKEAALHHNDTNLVDALGHAAATAARAHSRVGDGPPGGEAEDAAAATARSGVLGAAIQARLNRGDTEGANALFTQVQDQLDPEHASALGGQFSGEPARQPVAENEAISANAGEEPATVLSDASPEPLQAGQQYAAAGDEDEAGHKPKGDPAYQIKKSEHTATPTERAAHGDAPLEILRLPPLGIPGIGSKGASNPAPPGGNATTTGRPPVGSAAPPANATAPSPGKSPTPETQQAAGNIASHAFQEHVVERGKFPGIYSPSAFTNHIADVMTNPTDSYHLGDGRTIYWHEPSKTLVIHDPSEEHGGTAFKPDMQKKYYDNMIEHDKEMKRR